MNSTTSSSSSGPDPSPPDNATRNEGTEEDPRASKDSPAAPESEVEPEPSVALADLPPAHRAGLRSAIHFSALALAFPLTYLASMEPQWLHRSYAAGVCLLGVFVNLLVLPHLKLGQAIRREGESSISGIWLYPLGLALSFMLYPSFAVGAAWAAMATGDAAAVTIGRRFPNPGLGWNERKSWAGLLAFVVAAIPTSFCLLWWCPGELLSSNGTVHLPTLWTVAVVAGISGAILESLKGPFDDNLRLPLGVGLIVWLAALLLHFSMDSMPFNRPLPPEGLLHALLANGVLMAVVVVLGFADLGGALVGGLAGMIVFFFALPQGYALLIVFVIGGSLLSRLGRKTKQSRGVEEARGGRRGMANAAANLSVPALCCVVYPASGGHPAALLAMVGGLSAALADTASSEIGSLAERKPRMIVTGEEVDHGTNGGVSVLGYGAAYLSSSVLALAAWGSGFWSVIDRGHLIWNDRVEPKTIILFGFVTVSAGLFGTTVDSILGARMEGKVPGVGKGAVNFLCTLAGAGWAGAIGMLLW